jgi:ankyrin repeat protein
MHACKILLLFFIFALSFSSWTMSAKETLQETLNTAVERNDPLIFENINGQLVIKVSQYQGIIINSKDISFNQRITYKEVQETFLHMAIHHGNVSLVENLVSHARYLVNTGNENNVLPLTLAYDKLKNAPASPNLQEIFSILLRNTTNINISLDPSIANGLFAADIVNIRLKNLLINAYKNGINDASLKEISRLLGMQNRLEGSWVFEGENFLKWAAKLLAEQNYPQIENIASSFINALLNHDQRQFFVNELLCFSCFLKNPIYVEFCIQYGANINYTDSAAKTALHHAFTTKRYVDKQFGYNSNGAAMNVDIVRQILRASTFCWNDGNLKALDALIQYNPRDCVVNDPANPYYAQNVQFYQNQWKEVVQFLIECSAPFTSDHLNESEDLQIELKAAFDKGIMPHRMLANDERVKSWSMRPVTNDEQLSVAKFNYILTLGLAKITMRDDGALGCAFITKSGYRIKLLMEPLMCEKQQVFATIAEDGALEIKMSKEDIDTLLALLKKFPNIAQPNCSFIDLTEGGKFTL